MDPQQPSQPTSTPSQTPYAPPQTTYTPLPPHRFAQPNPQQPQDFRPQPPTPYQTQQPQASRPTLPSLPPRPILIAHPRGSNVLQSVPAYQRRPMPSRPHHFPPPPPPHPSAHPGPNPNTPTPANSAPNPTQQPAPQGPNPVPTSTPRSLPQPLRDGPTPAQHLHLPRENTQQQPASVTDLRQQHHQPYPEIHPLRLSHPPPPPSAPQQSQPPQPPQQRPQSPAHQQTHPNAPSAQPKNSFNDPLRLPAIPDHRPRAQQQQQQQQHPGPQQSQQQQADQQSKPPRTTSSPQHTQQKQMESAAQLRPPQESILSPPEVQSSVTLPSYHQKNQSHWDPTLRPLSAAAHQHHPWKHHQPEPVQQSQQQQQQPPQPSQHFPARQSVPTEASPKHPSQAFSQPSPSLSSHQQQQHHHSHPIRSTQQQQQQVAKHELSIQSPPRTVAEPSEPHHHTIHRHSKQEPSAPATPTATATTPQPLHKGQKPKPHIDAPLQPEAQPHSLPQPASSGQPSPPAVQASTTAADPQDTPQRRQLKVEDALAYLEKVKIQFADQVDVYNQFLDIMKEFKAQTINTTEVIRRVSNLFRGHMDLILGFNTFLPPGYEIKVTEDKTTGVLNTGFEGPEGFSELPPCNSAPSAVQAKSSNKKAPAASSPKRKDAKSKGSSVKLQQARAGADAMEKESASIHALTSKSGGPSKTTSAARRLPGKGMHTDENGPHPSSTPQRSHQQIESSMAPDSEKAQQFDRAIEYVTTIKERFADDPETFDKFLSALNRFRNEPASIREVFDFVADLFGPHKDLLQQFKEFLPAISLGSLDKPINSKPPTMATQRRPQSGKGSSGPRKGVGGPGLLRARRARDMHFFDDLKASLGQGKSDVYTDFIKCLSLFSQKVVSKEELLGLTAGILQECPHAHNMFLQYLEAICGSGDETMDEGNQISSSMSSEEAPAPLDVARHAKYLKKTVSETGGEYGVEKIVSYSKLPPDFPSFSCSGRSTMEKRTLNDTWVSGTSGSEDYSFKFMRKNQNEDNLFRCEDDRYELDMVIATNASTIQKLQTIVESMSRLPPAEKKRHQLAQGALSPINFSAIQRIYGEKGAEIVEEVKLNPAQAAPFVVERLRNRDAQWTRARHEMNRAWREVGERNYHRSLDHRSVHFKHVDKKELSTKNILADLLEPASSLQARDAEMTKARGYPVPFGGGGANHRSLIIKAVKEAAQRASDLEPPHLDLCLQECRIHKVVFDLLKERIEADTSSASEAKRIVDEFRKLIQRFFAIKLSEDVCTRVNCETRDGPHDTVLLYGDDCMYLMLRLYHLLCERIMEGLKLAREQVADREKRRGLNQAGAERVGDRSHIPLLATTPASLISNFPSGQEKEHFTVGPMEETADEIFQQFLEALRQFLGTNKADVVNKYEERCRVLLGAGCYCLFTLDKTVAKTVKQVIAAFSGDYVSEYGTVAMFHLFRDRIEESVKAGGNLNWSSLEKQYASAAVAQIGKTRGSGSNIMRFTSRYREGEFNEFVIYAVGQTVEGSNSKGKGGDPHEEAAEFCKRLTALTGARENTGSSSEADSRRKGETGQARKRPRSNDSDFVRFAGCEEQVRKRAKTMKLSIGGGLIWKLDEKKRLKALEGTYEFMQNSSRTRKMWSDTPDAKDMNERCRWAREVRRKMKLAQVADTSAMEVDTAAKPVGNEEKGSGQEQGGAPAAKEEKASASQSVEAIDGDVADKDKMTDV